MTFDKSLLKKLSWLKLFFLIILLLESSALQTEAVQTNILVQKFVSCINGQEDYYALLPGKNNTLIVYLHSFVGDYKEPFQVIGEQSLASAVLKEFPGVSFVSLNYGSSPSWGNPAARVDISNNLRSVIKQLNIKRVIFIGVSMGAATALTYAATAPSAIREKIIGVVAVSPWANMEDLYKQTGDADLKSSLESVFGNAKGVMPIAYEQNSFDTCVPFLPTNIKVGIVSATEDKQIPIELQKVVSRDLINREISTKTFEIEGKFESLPIKSMLESCNFIVQKNQ